MEPNQNHFAFENAKSIKFEGGTMFRVAQKEFPALKELAIQSLHLKPGVVREPHSHPNAHQLDYCVSGAATVGIIGPEGHKQYLKLKEGDISFVPKGYIHWIENSGKTDLHFLVILSHEEPETIELSETLMGVPKSTLSKVLSVSEDYLGQMPTKTVTISK
jgi:oxalate decarboxylase/phosphoglucose isomerase-like protein (cupin superfamily)